jgi:hypothetical protein
MATFLTFSEATDIKSNQDLLEQPIEIIQNDISSSSTRRKDLVFVTGGNGPGVTSSLFQTIFDQDFSLQTANPIFDITFGLNPTSSVVLTGSYLFTDSTTGKMYFSSQSIQMREKIQNYKMFAQTLLGNADEAFTLTTGSVSSTINMPMFLCFKRIFARDRMKRETLAIRMYTTCSMLSGSATGEKIYTDVGSSTNIQIDTAGQVSTIVDSSNTSWPVGLMYLDRGVAVLDMERVLDTGQWFSGSIDGISTSGTVFFSGSLQKFLVSASIDDIADHVCSTRFSSSNATAVTFQNQTYLNSTMYYCRFRADDCNYSSNPTYTDSDGRVVVIDPGQEEVQQSFSFMTSIGLYNARDELLAVAKLSRPLLKDKQRDYTVKVRLDF